MAHDLALFTDGQDLQTRKHVEPLRMAKDTVLQAELVGRDPPTDVGILRIPSRSRLLTKC